MFSAFAYHMILSPKHLPRLAATLGLFTNYGLRELAKRQGLLNIEGADLAAGKDSEGGESAAKAKAFRARLVELGPAYIKLGQVLSTRPDLLPRPYIEELEHLQDDVPPMPYGQVEQTIEEELHARISKLFASFEQKPLGSASLGQVHAAELRGTFSLCGLPLDSLHEFGRSRYPFERFEETRRCPACHVAAGRPTA